MASERYLNDILNYVYRSMVLHGILNYQRRVPLSPTEIPLALFCKGMDRRTHGRRFGWCIFRIYVVRIPA